MIREVADPLPVYLVHYGAPEWCAASTRSLLASEGVTLDVSVVDNGGGRLSGLLPMDVRVIPTGRNLGFAGGANRAIADWQARYPSGRWLLIGSHDLQVERHSVQLLVEAAAAHPNFGILAPLVEGREHRIPHPYSKLKVGTVVPSDWLSGTCMLIRRECIEHLGGFEEAFGSYVEDVELCLRAQDAGWSVGVVMGCSARGLGSADELARDRLIAANSVLLARRRGGRRAGANATVRLAGLAVRHGAAGIWPGRPANARRRSRYLLAVDVHALGRVVVGFLGGAWRPGTRE